MIGTLARGTAALACLAILGACGSNGDDREDAGFMGVAQQAVGQVITTGQTRRAAPKEAPPSPQSMAAEALRVNPGPLIMAGLESMNTTQILAMMGENGGMRTYMTKNKQALIMRGGILTGTRGLGNDISVVEGEQVAALIRSGRSGQAQKVIRYYAGDGKERPLPTFTCTVSPGPKPGVTLETCEGGGAKFQNNYLVSGGNVSVSRQWAGPGLGYITITQLRP